MKSIYYDNNYFTEFEGPNEYYEWFEKNYSSSYINYIYSFPQKIDELNPLLYYQGHGYLKINKFLREYNQDKNISTNNSIYCKAKAIQEFINNTTLNNNMVLYRFSPQIEYKYLIKHKKKIKPIKQFLSTTTIPKFCNDDRYNKNLLIKILINKNSKAIAFTDVNKKHIECEILLPYNSQLKFLYYDKEKIPVFHQFYSITQL